MRFDTTLAHDAWHVSEFRDYALTFRLIHGITLTLAVGSLVLMRATGFHGPLALLPTLLLVLACYRLARHGYDSGQADQAAADWTDEVAKVISPALRIPIEAARHFGAALPTELLDDSDCESGYVVHGAVGGQEHILRIDADGSFTLTAVDADPALAA